MSSNEETKSKRCGRRMFWMVPLFGIAILAKAGLVMLIWNALIPDLFHGPVLTYVQALGLMVLAKLMVGFGFKRHGHHHGWKRHHWMHMSQEEREKLREEFRKRFEK